MWTPRFVFPVENVITHDFGPERYGWHYGVDMRVAYTDTIVSAMDGVVRLTKYDKRGFGRVVVIRHAQGLETIYGHLSKAYVTANQPVKAGEPIGMGGNSGRSTGPHLHFEIRYLGEPLNPHDFMDFDHFQLKYDTLVLTRASFEYLVELRKAKYYTIKSGDTLSGIAVRYHTTVSKLCALNGISSKTILRVGRKIRYQ
jgi:murein DD-endopeptidase MepM/ murein hydrolase activator NlpD